MTKHIISEKLKSNLSSISSMTDSNVSTTLDDAYYTKISGGQNTTVRMNDSFADIAAKIFNLIDLNKQDRKRESKLIEPEEVVEEKYTKVEPENNKGETKPDELDTVRAIEVYEGWRIYEYWKMLKSGDTLTKLISWFKSVGQNIFEFKWLKDIATFGLDIVKGAMKLAETALKFVPSAGTIARIGVGVGSAVGMAKLIASGESGKDAYNAANRGLVDDSKTKIRKYTGGENFSGMTVGEISRRQHLSRNDSEYISAVGKYQMIRITMDDAIRRGFVKPSETFSPEVQDRLFSEYLIKGKRPEIVKYLEASPDDPGIINGSLLDGALAGLSNEFASVEYKSGSGVSKSGQAASISAEQASAELLAMRNETQGIKPTPTETPAPTTTSTTPTSPTIHWKPEPVETTKGSKLNESSKDRPYTMNNGVKFFVQPIIQQTNSTGSTSTIETPTDPDLSAYFAKE